MKIRELSDTVALMNSADYKERFIAEYWRLKIRYEKLKSFNNKIEAYHRRDYTSFIAISEPKHDCPYEILKEQENLMKDYLHILELRAVYEEIDLGE